MRIKGTFLVAVKRTKGIKVRLEDGTETWMNCVGDESKGRTGDAVIKGISGNYTPDSPITLDVDKNEETGKYYVKGYVKEQSSQNTSQQTNQKKCKSCGKTLKNPKYDNCYTCNQKTKSTSNSGGSYQGSSIRSQAVGKMTSETVKAMLNSLQGQLEPNQIVDFTKTYIEEIFNQYNDKVE